MGWFVFAKAFQWKKLNPFIGEIRVKLLCITPEYPPMFGGGIISYYGSLLPALAAKGWDVTVLVGSAVAPGPEATEQAGVKIIPLDQNLSRKFAKQFSQFSLSTDFRSHLGSSWASWYQTNGGQGFDVVECTDWGLPFVSWLTNKEAPPLLVRLHASLGQIADHEPNSQMLNSEALYRMTEQLLLPLAATRSTYSTNNQNYWTRSLNCPTDYVIPPIPTDDQSTSLPRSNRGLVIGRVQQWKGPRTLCRALERLGPRAPEMDWVGRDMAEPDGVTLGKKLSRQHPEIWNKIIQHHPSVTPPEVRGFQSKAAFVVVPSTWDVFNLACTEAMGTGAVVICSRGAGAADTIIHGKNGFLFDADNDQQLAECIQSAITLTPTQRIDMGRSAREILVNRYSLSSSAQFHHDQLIATAQSTNTRCVDRIANQFQPSDASDVSNALERIPLRDLLNHVGHRIRQKLGMK